MLAGTRNICVLNDFEIRPIFCVRRCQFDLYFSMLRLVDQLSTSADQSSDRVASNSMV
jgi:hypothetical protein